MKILVKRENNNLQEGILSDLLDKLTGKDKYRELEVIINFFRECKSIASSEDEFKSQFPKSISKIIFSKNSFSLSDFIKEFKKLDDSDKSKVIDSLNQLKSSFNSLIKIFNSKEFSNKLDLNTILGKK